MPYLPSKAEEKEQYMGKKSIFLWTGCAPIKICTCLCGCILCIWSNLALTGSKIRALTGPFGVMSGHCSLVVVTSRTHLGTLAQLKRKQNYHLERLVTVGRRKVRSGSVGVTKPKRSVSGIAKGSGEAEGEAQLFCSLGFGCGWKWQSTWHFPWSQKGDCHLRTTLQHNTL